MDAHGIKIDIHFKDNYYNYNNLKQSFFFTCAT